MFIVLLKFSTNKASAGDHMTGHNEWLKKGFDDGVFLMAGSLEPGLGGSVMASGLSLSSLEQRVNEDPFVSENVVSAEILQISPKMLDGRLSFLNENKP